MDREDIEMQIDEIRFQPEENWYDLGSRFSQIKRERREDERTRKDRRRSK